MRKEIIMIITACLVSLSLVLSGCGAITFNTYNNTVAGSLETSEQNVNAAQEETEKSNGMRIEELREDLIAADSFKSDELTEKEKQVDDKLYTLREELVNAYDGNPYRMRLLADETLTTSGLYEFCVEIPKGGELHVHSQAMLDFDTMLNLTLEKNAYVVMEKGEDFCKIGTLNNKPVDYECEYIPLREAIDSKRLDIDTIKHYWIMRDYLDNEHPWDVFNDLWIYTNSFYSSPEIEYDYYVAAFNMYMDYGAQVVEMRDSPFSELVTDEEYQTLYHHLETIRQAYYDVKKDHPELIVRVILSPSHRIPNKDSEFIGHVLDKCTLLYDELMDETMEGEEHFISGFDLVGEEDDCFPLSEYEELFKTADLPEGFNLYLHCGESHQVDNVNMFDAYRFGTVRVGHGFNLYRYPNLMEKYKDAGITMEICPISNMQLGYIGDLRSHPAVEYMKRGMSVVISSDDPQYMENKTLVDDYFAAIVCWNLNLAQIKQLSRNAVLNSSLTGKALEQALDNWQIKWDKWIESNIVFEGTVALMNEEL